MVIGVKFVYKAMTRIENKQYIEETIENIKHTLLTTDLINKKNENKTIY
jgi:hypothetical protein